MWKFKRRNIQPIGLDLGHDSVKLLQLQVQGGTGVGGDEKSLSVVAAARQAISEEARRNPNKRVELAAPVIERMLSQQPFFGREVVATLPREMVHVRQLRLPQMPAEQLDAAVHAEALTVFPFKEGEARIEFLSAGEARQGGQTRQEVIVLAAKHTDIEKYLRQLDQCGLVVKALDVEFNGIFRAFERFIRREADQVDVQLLVDIGARRTQVLIARGRDLCFYKPIEIGGLHLLDAVSRKLAISIDEARALRHRLVDGDGAHEQAGKAKTDPVRQAVFDATRSVAEELARQLAMCHRYFTVTFRGHRPVRVRLIGGEAADPQLQAAVQAELQIPVETGRPLFSVDISKMKAADRRGSMSQWTLAMGLSLRFTEGYFAAKDGKPRTQSNVPASESEPAPDPELELANA